MDSHQQEDLMSSPNSDITFTGSIPKLYESYLVPLIFAPFAGDMAARLAHRSVSSVLEIAAGTGAVTRALASALPENVSIVATDLNEAMLEHAQSVGTSRPVEWRQADAAALPFPDETFDAVICQFGVMFFPDKAKAFAEAHRVLRPGGDFSFQRVGSNRREPIRQYRDNGARIDFSAGPAAFSCSRSSWLLLSLHHREGSGRRRVYCGARIHDSGEAE